MTALSFSFTKLVVSDLHASEQFYIRTLGLSRVTYVEFGEGWEQLQEIILAVPNGAPGSPQLILIHTPNRPMQVPGD